MPKTEIKPRERLFDANALVTRAVHLQTMVVEPPIDCDLFEWLTESAAFDAIAKQLDKTTAELDEALNECGSDTRAREEGFCELVSFRLDGWLVEIDQAHFEPSPGTGMCSVRGGWRQGAVFYAATYDEALEAGLTWAEARLEAAMAAAR